jgi:hypothetical protein
MARLAQIALAVLVTTTATLGAETDDLLREADQCSTAALKAYALSTCETSEAILNAAFAKCRSQWNALVSEMVKQQEADPALQAQLEEARRKSSSRNPAWLDHLKSLDEMDDIEEGAFRAHHQTDVFDFRVASPNKLCLPK